MQNTNQISILKMEGYIPLTEWAAMQNINLRIAKLVVRNQNVDICDFGEIILVKEDEINIGYTKELQRRMQKRKERLEKQKELAKKVRELKKQELKSQISDLGLGSKE